MSYLIGDMGFVSLLDPIGSQYIRAISVTACICISPDVENQILPDITNSSLPLKSARVQEYKSTRVQEYKSTRVQE